MGAWRGWGGSVSGISDLAPVETRTILPICVCWCLGVWKTLLSEVMLLSIVSRFPALCWHTVVAVVGSGVVAKSCPDLGTPWTVAHQAPLSMGFSRPPYWSELPFPSPGDLPDPGIEPGSPALRADALPTEL